MLLKNKLVYQLPLYLSIFVDFSSSVFRFSGSQTLGRVRFGQGVRWNGDPGACLAPTLGELRRYGLRISWPGLLAKPRAAFPVGGR